MCRSQDRVVASPLFLSMSLMSLRLKKKGFSRENVTKAKGRMRVKFDGNPRMRSRSEKIHESSFCFLASIVNLGNEFSGNEFWFLYAN